MRQGEIGCFREKANSEIEQREWVIGVGEIGLVTLQTVVQDNNVCTL